MTRKFMTSAMLLVAGLSGVAMFGCENNGAWAGSGVRSSYGNISIEDEWGHYKSAPAPMKPAPAPVVVAQKPAPEIGRAHV